MCDELTESIKKFIEKEVDYRVRVMKKFEIGYKGLFQYLIEELDNQKEEFEELLKSQSNEYFKLTTAKLEGQLETIENIRKYIADCKLPQ